MLYRMRTDIRTGLTKLIFAFLNSFVNTPKNLDSKYHHAVECVCACLILLPYPVPI